MSLRGELVKSIILVSRPTQLDIGMQGWLETFGRFFEKFQEPERTKVCARHASALADRRRDGQAPGLDILFGHSHRLATLDWPRQRHLVFTPLPSREPLLDLLQQPTVAVGIAERGI